MCRPLPRLAGAEADVAAVVGEDDRHRVGVGRTSLNDGVGLGDGERVAGERGLGWGVGAGHRQHHCLAHRDVFLRRRGSPADCMISCIFLHDRMLLDDAIEGVAASATVRTVNQKKNRDGRP